MIYRILKSVWNLVLFYTLAYLVAFKSGATVPGLVLKDTGELIDFTQVFRLFLFWLMIFLYSNGMSRHQRALSGMKIVWIVFGKVKKNVNKILFFHKGDLFWGVCLITGFAPLFIPLVIWIIARLLLYLIVFIFSPIIYPISQICLAINGTVK